MTRPALRRRSRFSDGTPRERREPDRGTCCPDYGGDLRVTQEACDSMRTFGATGEDVSELPDMVGAQMKVIYYPAVAAYSDERANRPDQEILPPLRADGAGTGTQPSDPGQYGRAKPAGPFSGHRCEMPCRAMHVLVSKFDDHLICIVSTRSSPVWGVVIVRELMAHQ